MLEAATTKAISRRLEDLKGQKTKLKRMLKKCWWGVILEKPIL